MNPPRSARWPVVCLLALIAAVHGCSRWQPALSEAQRYDRWRQAHTADVTAYSTWLRTQQLHQVAPMSSLLRSSRRWRECQADEFATPPRAQWEAMQPTLRLLATLQAHHLLDGRLIRSAYRDDRLNACSGGSAASRHLRNNALDLDLPEGVSVAALCSYWRREGAKQRMGLGFYTPTRIHIDTSGFRTWGTDHRRGSSLCVAPPQRN
ncbi:MAG TPA: D-Ala-D-Ala carboxypeptidase family metallohydrolase [Pseudoxanthomonas sp.]|nr:D-Ala-D-Ala carboxypeptidase family metallohydrolase [Pseudoxanthomonas sp.]